MPKVLFISQVIRDFRTTMKCSKLTMQDLAWILDKVGCHKTPDGKMYYEDEVYDALKYRQSEIKSYIKRLYPDMYVMPSAIPNRTFVMPRHTKPEEDETDMNYASRQLLKDDEVFFESVNELVSKYGEEDVIKYIKQLD